MRTSTASGPPRREDSLARATTCTSVMTQHCSISIVVRAHAFIPALDPARQATIDIVAAPLTSSSCLAAQDHGSRRLEGSLQPTSLWAQARSLVCAERVGSTAQEACRTHTRWALRSAAGGRYARAAECHIASVVGSSTYQDSAHPGQHQGRVEPLSW